MDTTYEPNIMESHEAERGCGFRKPGGFYLVGPTGGYNCGRLPISLAGDCEKCGRKWKQGRALETNVNLDILIGNAPCASGLEHCSACPVHAIMERGGFGEGAINWVGEKHYTAEEFLAESGERGASRRLSSRHVDAFIAWIQERGGDTPWVALAHPQALDNGSCERCATGIRIGDLLDTETALWEVMDIEGDEGEEGAITRLHTGNESVEGRQRTIAFAAVDAGEVKVTRTHQGKVWDEEEGGKWVKCQQCGGRGRAYAPGIFEVFKPSGVEYVVDRKNDTPEKWADLEAKGVKLVDVIPVKEPEPEAKPATADMFDAFSETAPEAPEPEPEKDSIAGADGQPISVDDRVEPTPEMQEKWKNAAWPTGSTAVCTALDSDGLRIEVRRVAPGVEDFVGLTVASQWVKRD